MNLPVIPSFQGFGKENFNSFSRDLFLYQIEQNQVYRNFVNNTHRTESDLSDAALFPFLPIGFFKTHEVYCGYARPPLYFESSGTGRQTVSKHYLKDLTIYEASFLQQFHQQYGPPDHWCIMGLLPSYLERSHSSLVYMVESLMKLSNHPSNGFYLHNHDALFHTLSSLESIGQKTVLFGTTFALLDFSEKYSLPLSHTVLIETGGMKGRREELLREQVHEQLKKAFPEAGIHSEYGMTELCSQAYAKENGLFFCPPWMKVLVRDEDDPFRITYTGKGALNIIDLANVYSCAFIATDDVGEVFEDGSFKVLGRMDNSDIRGCSLLTL
ncbi:MAG: acyl transferase [Bacteroidota bacterium]